MSLPPWLQKTSCRRVLDANVQTPPPIYQVIKNGDINSLTEAEIRAASKWPLYFCPFEQLKHIPRVKLEVVRGLYEWKTASDKEFVELFSEWEKLTAMFYPTRELLDGFIAQCRDEWFWFFSTFMDEMDIFGEYRCCNIFDVCMTASQAAFIEALYAIDEALFHPLFMYRLFCDNENSRSVFEHVLFPNREADCVNEG